MSVLNFDLSKYKLSIVVMATSLFCQCDFKPQPPEKVKAFAKEVESRKIKQVTSVQLLDAVKKEGSHILSVLTPENTDSIKNSCHCMIEKVALSATEYPDSTSRMLAEAFRYSASLGQSVGSTAQFSPDEKYLIYTSPSELLDKDSLPQAFWYIKLSKKDIILEL